MLTDRTMLLSSLIDQALIGPDDEALQGSSRSSGMHPSSSSAEVIDPLTGVPAVIGTCLRQAYYRMTGTTPTEPSTARGMRVMAMGDLLSNNFVYRPAMKAGIWASHELKIYDPDNKISGIADLIVRLPTGELMGVEVKSLGVYGEIPCIVAGKQGYQFLEPRYKDLPQVITYMQWFRRYGIRYWSLYYVSRDGATNEFVFEFMDPEGDSEYPSEGSYLRCHSTERTWDMPWITWGAVKVRYRQLLEALNKGEPPPRDFTLQYPDEFLVRMASTEEGNQLNSLTKTDRATINKKLAREKEGKEITKPYSLKGDKVCQWCSYSTLCWQGLSPEGTSKVPISEPIRKIDANNVEVRL